MAFTIEQVEHALVTPMTALPRYMPQNVDRKKSSNYVIITSYLTGKINSLGGLVQDEEIFYWSSVLNLINRLENITPNDQLVLDVLYNPTVFPSIEWAFKLWLLHYAIENKTDQAFAAVKHHFQQQGMNDDVIFNYCVSTVDYDTRFEIDLESTGLEQFLLKYVQRQTKIVHPAGRFIWHNKWNLLYFKLLEQAKPEFVEEYLVSGIGSRRHQLAAFLDSYKDGKYINQIVLHLINKQNFNSETIEQKFSFALELFETNNNKYRSLLIELAQQYLDHLIILGSEKNWEPTFHLTELEKISMGYFPFSAVAFHLLLQDNKENALKILHGWMEQKRFIQYATFGVLEHHLKSQAFPLIESAFTRDAAIGGIEYVRQAVGLLQEKFEPSQYLPLLWKLSNSKSKPVRELIAKVIFEKDPDAEVKAIELLNSKNSESRQTAAIALSHFSSTTSKDAVMRVLNAETNDNARDILLQTVADNLPTKASMAFIEDMVLAAKKRGKLNKPVESWLEESALPPLFYTTGKELTIDEKRFLLYRMSRIKEMRSDMEARYILQFLDKGNSSDFAIQIIKLYIEKGSKPENKYLMALAALLGDDRVVDKIRITINKWMDENRYKMAEHGVGAMALQGSDKALRWVEWYSRKYKSKKANVGAAALLALENAAQELGITIHELGDRVVPDFGFEGLFKNFTVENEEYRAFIDSNFKIAFFNEDNKKLKAIPSATDAALKEEFKNIAKEVRDIVKSQSSRLEYYLIIQRRWAFDKWQSFFLQNPVMFIYATKLLWATYDEQCKILQTFICNEDTGLINVENEEISLDESSTVGIVHPSQLNTHLLRQWQQQFFDLQIDPVFPQLDRKMPDLNEFDLTKSILTRFEGKKMKEGSIRSTLEKYGWHKGPTGDGGMLESFNLLYFEKRLEAVLEVEGVGAGYGWGQEEKLGRFYIVDKSKVTQRWFYPKDDKDENLVAFEKVPIIFLCEAIAAIQSIKEFENPSLLQ